MKNLFIGSALSIMLFVSGVYSQGVPAPFTIRLQPFITGGLNSPVFMTNAGDGTNRLFIVEQGGIIRVVQPGQTAPTTFLNIQTRVVSGGERGLLGLAFHPNYGTNRRFFVYYTRHLDGAIQIAEYQASSDPNQADDTEKIIITIPHPNFSNHNGGTVAFGADGFLYAGTGDGGSGNDPSNNAQNIEQLLGKFIRLDINGVPPQQIPQYNIPPDNPFAGATPGRDEIYAVGVRNPYRFSFDRGGTNELWAGDVGQGSWEEVDIITLGGNYGWRIYEGNQCTNIDGCIFPPNYVAPEFAYSSSGSGNPRCSITGGYVYRGTQGNLPAGGYMYGDYCSGEILLWNNGQQTVLLDTTRNITSFAEDENGELYVLGHNGTVDKIVRARASADLDGDFKTDIGVFRPSNGFWYALDSSNNSIREQQLGASGDMPVPEDYDGDNVVDLAYFRPSDGTWNYLLSETHTVVTVGWGQNGDIPASGDFDGDARSDFTVFRPSTGVWYTLRSSDEQFEATAFGVAGDQPVAGDYDGDGKYDIAVWRPSGGIWYRLDSSSGSFVATQWGTNGDVPAPGDFDGDGKIDLTVYRPSSGAWYTRRSSNGGLEATQWGISTDIPVVGDYDGDGREDIGVFRPSTGVWYVRRSSNSSLFALQWGAAGDIPVPARDNP